MNLPNFLIIGTAKGGTTSLYHYLAQHPDIYMSPTKEPRFFAPEFYTNLKNRLEAYNSKQKKLARLDRVELRLT